MQNAIQKSSDEKSGEITACCHSRSSHAPPQYYLPRWMIIERGYGRADYGSQPEYPLQDSSIAHQSGLIVLSSA